jgi:hypothetical protein
LATHLQRSALELLFVSRENERGGLNSSRKVSARTFGNNISKISRSGFNDVRRSVNLTALNSQVWIPVDFFFDRLVSRLECYKATHECATPFADVARRSSSPGHWLRVLFAPWIRGACWHVDQFSGHRLDN